MDKKYFVRVRGKIGGPFDTETLQSMARRGRFARHHEVSPDRQTWFRAADFPELFPERAKRRKVQPRPKGSAAVEDEKENTTPATSGGATSDGYALAATPAETARWYYGAEGEQSGPVTTAQLRELYIQGTLSKESYVWNPYMVDWTLASDVPELASVLSGGVASGAAADATLQKTAVVASGDATDKPHAKKHWKTPVVLTVAILLAVSLAGLATIAAVHFLDDQAEVAAQPVTKAMDDDAIASSIGFVVTGVKITEANGTEKAVALSTGSGFTVSPDGYVLTNKHVVEQTSKWLRADKTYLMLMWTKLLKKQLTSPLTKVQPLVWVFFKKKKYRATIVHVSDHFDFAILKVARSSAAYFTLSETRDLGRGSQVFACGFPGAAQTALSKQERVEELGRAILAGAAVETQFKDRDFVFGMTSGTVSRVVTEKDGRTWIQHNADINHGNSGGPLIGENGQVLGINTLGLDKAHGIFYALAVSQLRSELKKFAPGVAWK